MTKTLGETFDEWVEEKSTELARTARGAGAGGEGGEDVEAPYAEFRDRPADFVRIVIGVEPTPYQIEFLRAWRDDPRTAWKACRGAGKSAGLAWGILWWLLTRPLSRIQLLAPTKERQLSEFLIPEVEKWVRHTDRDLPIDVLGTRVEVSGYGKRWSAIASQATDPDKIEGLHAKHVAIVVDEAKGVPQDVVDALQGTQTDPEGDRAFVLVSKPGNPEGPFYEAFDSKADLWTTFSTDAFEVIDVGRMHPDWPDERAEDWGEDSALYRRNVLAEFAEDAENAPWDRGMIASNRIPIVVENEGATREELVRAELARRNVELTDIVVALDPSGTKGGDEAGIVVSGRGYCSHCLANGATSLERHGYVLEDVSGQLSPSEWARAAIDAYHRWEADYIVAEKNYGGEMVRTTLRSQFDVEHIPIRLVSAKKGRALRFQPVASLDENGKIHHVGRLGDLEGQMCGWDPEEERTGSPDRVDARVYTFYELFGLRRGGDREKTQKNRGSFSYQSFR